MDGPASQPRDPDAVRDDIRALLTPELAPSMLSRLAKGNAFDELIADALAVPGLPRAWATVVLHIRAIRADTTRYGGGIIESEQLLSAAAGLQRGVSKTDGFLGAVNGLVGLLGWHVDQLRGNTAGTAIADRFAADRDRLAADERQIVERAELSSPPSTLTA